MTTTLHTIGAPSWVEKTFSDYPRTCTASTDNHVARQWTIKHDDGLAPVTDLKDSEAIWIAPESLIALNAWRQRHHLSPLDLESPSANWLSGLGPALTGRAVITTTASDIRSWTEIPSILGPRPWSQLSQGRVSEFRAARRNFHQLQMALTSAPANASITLSGHIPTITEEWCVIINHGMAVAASGYCVHQSAEACHAHTAHQTDKSTHASAGPTAPPETKNQTEQADTRANADESNLTNSNKKHDGSNNVTTAQLSIGRNNNPEFNPLESHDILTVFDGARFHEQYREPAIKMAQIAAMTSGLNRASIIVAFAAGRPHIIEADPLWCTAPYPFESDGEITAFLSAIAGCRMNNDNDHEQQTRNHSPESTVTAYEPDAWMLFHNQKRYAGYS
ncbi:hypothetical protein GA0061078_1164 [Bifidobacterium bohemicum]|uniref:Uncharacterized protein n=1 Tax=Bifidobacterium bohemicum DSM 22767 TaxID=1437606 RepID=A0A086ZGE4_9BIFI|nr:hypothetical protein [Bifidobacterium bohemicum]KFI45594.1 hypothetical protein BBOH_0994 [Bifidobacterium bohemicum DSM 22767]SCC01101.1 hypothetical protein GA0061078_1164 [Bifidobacterium bohemicum]